jgi:hypothetical protein
MHWLHWLQVCVCVCVCAFSFHVLGCFLLQSKLTKALEQLHLLWEAGCTLKIVNVYGLYTVFILTFDQHWSADDQLYPTIYYMVFVLRVNLSKSYCQFKTGVTGCYWELLCWAPVEVDSAMRVTACVFRKFLEVLGMCIDYMLCVNSWHRITSRQLQHITTIHNWCCMFSRIIRSHQVDFGIFWHVSHIADIVNEENAARWRKWKYYLRTWGRAMQFLNEAAININHRQRRSTRGPCVI